MSVSMACLIGLNRFRFPIRSSKQNRGRYFFYYKYTFTHQLSQRVTRVIVA
jgi:hypothetical protein